MAENFAQLSGSLYITGSISSSLGIHVEEGVLFSASAQIDHDALDNFVSNEHIDHSAVSITGTGALTGGGDITTSRTITLDASSTQFSSSVVNILNYQSVVSGSSQILDGSGIVSSSTQIDTRFFDIDGLVSSSTQVVEHLPNGTISQSAQISDLGYVDKSGTPANNQIAIFTDTNTIEGDSSLTWDDTTLAMTGELDVTGGITASANISGSGLLNIQGAGTSKFNSHLQAHCLGIGTGPSGTNGEIRAAGDITAYYSSDQRLKENVVNISSPLDKLNQINGVTFDWIPVEGIHSNEGHDIGVIAQEIESILPEVVTTRENGYKAVRYEKIVALLIEAIKEQQLQINELKSRL